jgi:hypothetical protein
LKGVKVQAELLSGQARLEKSVSADGWMLENLVVMSFKVTWDSPAFGFLDCKSTQQQQPGAKSLEVLKLGLSVLTGLVKISVSEF